MLGRATWAKCTWCAKRRQRSCLHEGSVEEGDDQAKQDQACHGRAGDLVDVQPSVHRHALPLVSSPTTISTSAWSTAWAASFSERFRHGQASVCPRKMPDFMRQRSLPALEYLHLMGFIYRDLKPENILLHQSAMSCCPTLTCLHEQPGGRCTSHDSSGDAQQCAPSRHTRSCIADLRTNSFVGTEEYIAPEVIKGCGPHERSRLWTLGILIYEMIFATTPFKGASRNATFSNVLRNDVTFPENIPISSFGKSLIRKLLIKDEMKRMGSQSGASEVKQHKWFAPISWGLLRNLTPPIVPAYSNGLDAINFRNVRESRSLNLDNHVTASKVKGAKGDVEIRAVAGKKGAHDEDGDAVVSNPFSGFNSVTLLHQEE
ncbi:hypothetical protein L7F22_067829 [Adiantum nelumboides]|nr:hypothetical protein [Adiantum nelumboides]